MQIEVKNLSIIFEQDEKKMTALKDISLDIKKGEFVCLLGPSDCGKSTLLKCHGRIFKANRRIHYH